MTDKVRITQILSNLVSNAIKYTHNGTVHIYTSIQDDELVLNVKDTGIGIKNTFDVFDAYNQEAAGYAQGPSSTGLGLEIVKKLSDLLGIDLQLVSGKSGTLFSLSLGKPMPNTLVATQPDAPTKESDHHFNGLNILIVDDSDINREIVKTMLEGIGGICVEAEDGYEAVKMVNNDNSFDVVLMDKHMPNMNGIDATQQIRRNTDLELQPIIIALTADAFDVDSEKWFSLGVNEIITKPFDMTVLTKTIVRCLRK